MNKIRHIIFAGTALISSAVFTTTSTVANELEIEKTLENVGFELPETVLHDVERDVYLVSNIAGQIPAKDDNGFIAKVAPDGTIIDLKWIDGAADNVTLHSPKGMAVRGDTLYIADIDTVRMFDAQNGAPKGEIALEGTTFLNDIILGTDGLLYVSESALAFEDDGFKATNKDAIYRIDENNSVTLWVAGVELQQPNGMEPLDGGNIAVVTRGGNSFYILDANGNKTSEASAPGKVLDGVVRLSSGQYLMTSWETSGLYRLDVDGTFTTVATLPVPAANIGFDAKRNIVLLPLLKQNSIALLPLSSSS